MKMRSMGFALALLLTAPGCVGKAKYDDAIAAGVALEQQIEDLHAELAAERARASELEGQLAGEKARTAELSDLLASLEERNADLKGNLVDLSGRLADMKARSRSDKEQKAELEALLAGLQEQSAATEAEVEASKARIAELDAERVRLAAEAAELRAQKEALAEKTKAYDDLVSALESEIEAGQIQITELSGRLTVNVSNAILFDSGKYTLKPAGVEALKKVAGILAQVDDRAIQVEGHTDDDSVRAGAAYADNWALSSLRASTVVALLVDEGVAPLNVRAVGLGEFRPVQPNETDEGKAANRRTEIVLVPKLD